MFNNVFQIILPLLKKIEKNIIFIVQIIYRQRNLINMLAVIIQLPDLNTSKLRNVFNLNQVLKNKPLAAKEIELLSTNKLYSKKALIVESDLVHKAFLCKKLNLAQYQCYLVDRSNIIETNMRKLFDLIFIELYLPEDQEVMAIIEQIFYRDRLLERQTMIIGLVSKEHESFLKLQQMIKDFINMTKISDCLIRTYSSKQLFKIISNNAVITPQLCVNQEQQYNLEFMQKTGNQTIDLRSINNIYFTNKARAMMLNKSKSEKKVTFNIPSQESGVTINSVNKVNSIKNRCIIF